MKTEHIANRACRHFVEARKPFIGSNMFAVRGEASHGHSDIYVVYSYGDHYPMYVAEAGYDDGHVQWYVNTDKSSQSTERHKSQARPAYTQCIPMTTVAMCKLAKHGIAGVAAGAGA
jgi:hypothetical protein